jgi:hypothetical protein
MFYNQTPPAVLCVLIAAFCVAFALVHAIWILLAALCCCTRQQQRYCCCCVPVTRVVRDASSTVDDRVAIANEWVAARLRGARRVPPNGCCRYFGELRDSQSRYGELVDGGPAPNTRRCSRAVACVASPLRRAVAWVDVNFVRGLRPLPRSEAFRFPQRVLVAAACSAVLSVGTLLLCNYLAIAVSDVVGGWRSSVQGAASATQVAFDAANDAVDFSAPTFAPNATWNNTSARAGSLYLSPLLFAAPKPIMIYANNTATNSSNDADTIWPNNAGGTILVEMPVGMNASDTGVWRTADNSSVAYEAAAAAAQVAISAPLGNVSTVKRINSSAVPFLSKLTTVLGGTRSWSPSSFSQLLAAQLVGLVLIPEPELEMIL